MPLRPLTRRNSGDLPRSAATVAVLAAGADAQTAAAAELEGIGQLRYCETADALGRLIDRNGIHAIVTEPYDSLTLPASSFIGRFRDRLPDVPIVVWLTPSPATVREMPAALGAGATDFSVRGFDRLGDLVRAALTPGWRLGASMPLLYLMRLLVPADLEEFVIVCAIKGSPRLTSSRVAEWIRVKERTLRDRLQHASLAPPSVFIDYATAVHAAYLLDPLGLQPGTVVERMRFGRTRSLNSLLRQYAGRSAHAVRQHGGLRLMLREAERSLRRPIPGPEDMSITDRYLMGELTTQQRTDLERWLAGAPAGAAEVLAGLRLILGDQPVSEEERVYRRRVCDGLRRELGRSFGS
jgi:hypothetical protein